MIHEKKRLKMLKLSNNVTVSLHKRDGIFEGIAEVKIDNVKMRNPQRPFFVSIRNPWAVKLSNYRLTKLRQNKKSTTLKFTMDASSDGPMEWMLHECRPMLNLSDWSKKPEPAKNTSLSMEIKPVGRKIGDRHFIGFSYRYSYRSKKIPVYKILDRATWEIGGKAVGNEVWLRNSNFPPVCKVSSINQQFSSEWYLKSCHNSNIFQLLPLQTHLQGFTMTAHKLGVLVTWCPEISHIRSLIEKPRAQNIVTHIHEHCNDLADKFNTAPMEVLFLKGEFSRTQLENIYGQISEMVQETLHSKAGIQREFLSSYGQIEEWGDADLAKYREKGLPALLDAGIKEIELANHFQNNMNTWGLSNMCCNVDFKVSENVGENKLKAFCADAAKKGARVLMWGNTAISTLTHKFHQRNGKAKGIKFLPEENSIMSALEKAKHPFVITPYGSIDADHYTPDFCLLNIRDPIIREYWLESWRKLARNIGIKGIFLDSSFNISSDKFNWLFNAESEKTEGATIDQTELLGGQRPEKTPPSAIQTQYFAHLSLIREMQNHGFKYCCEDAGVFGVHRTGPNILHRLDNMFMWNEFIACFDAESLHQTGHHPDEVFFKGLAFRMVWSIFWDPKSEKLSFMPKPPDNNFLRPSQLHISLIRAYAAVEKYMRNRTILPDNKGVKYQSGNKTVLWLFDDMELELEKTADITSLPDGNKTSTKNISARKNKIYIINSKNQDSR